MLKGYKTYIMSGLGACVTFAYMMEWIPRATWEALMGFLACGTASTLRVAVRDVQPPPPPA